MCLNNGSSATRFRDWVEGVVMPATAAQYITFLAKKRLPLSISPMAVFLSMNGKDTHYLCGIDNIGRIPAQNILWKSYIQKTRTFFQVGQSLHASTWQFTPVPPDNRHWTPEITNLRFLMCLNLWSVNIYLHFWALRYSRWGIGAPPILALFSHCRVHDHLLILTYPIFSANRILAWDFIYR